MAEMAESKLTHSTEYHMNCAIQLCRICGNRAQTRQQKRNNKVYYCKTNAEAIFQVFGIKISQKDSCD